MIMKKIALIFALTAFTTGFAQKNLNTQKETVITKTEVKDNKGTTESTKAVSIKKNQKVKLSAADVKKTNQNIVMTPVEVNTEVTYGYDGNRFQFLNQKDKDGYRLMTIKDNKTREEYAVIKPTSQNGYYIYSQNGQSSFGYFNEEGNFVVESYNPKTDAVEYQIYKMHLKDDKQ